ncbi:T9SS type A sorting domain-containing protein [Larkinella soli]|uniref:T9SS type A sorting domain-containing protein n=1 Tax=Larkinella soli TaxID=1770527 RepID=UPI000FFC89ED|nr:T9SS type A sorting domain-containing protein [Larkinella soli]
MKTGFTFLLVLGLAGSSFATHLLGGYIQARQVSGTATYEFTVYLYMDAIQGRQAAEQSTSIPFCFGDGSDTVTIPRVSTAFIDPGLMLIVFKTTHSYNGTGSGSYTVSVSNLTNRSSDMQNFPGSVNSPFYIETTIVPGRPNSTPVFQPLPGLLRASVNRKATFSFPATDAEGDSVAYYLVRIRKGDCGKMSQLVDEFIFPNDVSRKGTFKIDALSGEVTWDAPTVVGRYVFALVAAEWRNGVKISETEYEMVCFVDDRAGGNPGTVPPYEPVMERGLLTASDGGIDAQDLTIDVFPIPSLLHFTVVIKSAQPTTARFELIDLQGRIIEQIERNTPALAHETSIGNDQLPPGTYLLKTSARGRVFTQKVLKR